MGVEDQLGRPQKGEDLYDGDVAFQEQSYRGLSGTAGPEKCHTRVYWHWEIHAKGGGESAGVIPRPESVKPRSSGPGRVT